MFKDTTPRPGCGSNPRPCDQECDALPTDLSVLPHTPVRSSIYSDFIWIFLPPYKGVPIKKWSKVIFPILCILVIIFPKCMQNFPKCKKKGSIPKSKIKSLICTVKVLINAHALINIHSPNWTLKFLIF